MMKLHEDRYAFLAILNQAHDVSGIRLDILEKDYYVCLLLKEIAEKQKEIPVYFKGGTALYKALKSIRRFSEDIDLTVNIENCSNSQAKKRLESVTKKYTSLPRTKDSKMEENRKGSITTVYDYEPVVLINEFDPLQRFRHVKIEATSFTVSEPFTELEIEPVIYTFANEDQRRIMHENYGLLPFKIQTIKLERIFVDKIFAAEFYCNRGLYFDVAKHVYDVAVMLDLPSIKNLTSDLVELLRMIEYKRMEETRRIGSDLAHKSFTDFRIFHCFADNSTFDEELEKMQLSYVFNDSDILSKEFINQQWKSLKNILYQLEL